MPENSTLLDEQSLRRPDFQGGEPVELADGQRWIFPCPRVRLSPVRSPEGRIIVEFASSFGPELQDSLEEFDVAPTNHQEALAYFEIAIDLLSRNYNLKDEDYRRLLTHGLRDEPSAQRLVDIIRIASGGGVAGVGLEANTEAHQITKAAS